MVTFAERLLTASEGETAAVERASSRAISERPLNILHCLRAPVGGLFRHVLDLAAEQAARGHAVGILADATSSNALTAVKFAALEPYLKLGITLVPMRREPGIADVAASLSVFKAAHRLSVDVLHGHGAKGGTYARLASKLLNLSGRTTRCFYTPHGGSLHYAPGTLAGTVVAHTEYALGFLTHGLIFESAYAGNAYRRIVGKPACPVRVVHNGLNERDFAVRKLNPDAADFVFVGELRAIKGVDTLLSALAQIHAQRPVRAVIVGDGPDAASLRDMAVSLGLAGAVTFPGALPAPEAFLQGRCLVVPSRNESLPYVVLEAAAAGLPLISTNVGGIPEIIAGTATDLIPPDDVPALTAAMQNVLADPAAAEARAMELRNAVTRGFSVAGMTDSIVDFYRTSFAR